MVAIEVTHKAIKSKRQTFHQLCAGFNCYSIITTAEFVAYGALCDTCADKKRDMVEMIKDEEGGE